MKKLYPLIALIGLLVLTGCPQPDPGEDPVLTPIKTDYSIGAEGGELKITFKTNQTYEAKSNANWLKVSTPTKAVTTETVTVTAEANKSTEARTAKVTIKAGTLDATITVTQAGLVPTIDIKGSTSFTIGAEGGDVTVDVTSNVDYNVDIDVAWISRKGTTFTVKPNESESDRSGVITFSYGDISRVVSVKQNGKTPEPSLEIAPTSKNVGAAGETFTVTVTTNQGSATGKSSAEWVTVSGNKVTVAENTGSESRTATVTFTAGSLSKTLTIKQEGKASGDSVLENGGASTYNVSAEGEDITVTVRSNVEYKISLGGCDWITQTKAATVNEYQHIFHVSANEGDARTATISFTYDESLTFSVSVSQAAYVPPTDDPYIEINKTEVQAEAEGETITISVDANCEYGAECDDEWISITGVGAELTFDVAANPSTSARTAMIQLTYQWVQTFLTVVQAGAEDDEDPFDVGSNLSVNGTANCYVVTKSGNFTFDASVIGNGPDGFIWDEVRAADALLWPTSPELTKIEKGPVKPAQAFVLWNDGDVVTDVKYNAGDKTISFTATGNKGAALIGLYDKFSSAATAAVDEAIWSWLIWCTDSPKHFRQRDMDDNEYVLMDRNIGAISADPDAAKLEDTYGYYFQWGRPNPLKAYIGMAADFQMCQEEMKTALTHPTFVYNGGSKTNEWYNTGIALARVTADLWGNPMHMFATVGENAVDHHPNHAMLGELKKTIYDPCPPGYLVPPERTWELSGVNDDDEYTISFVENGAIIATENGDSFYPFAGYISGLQSGEQNYSRKLGYFGFKGYQDKLPKEGNPGNMCWDFRTTAGVYTSCTGHVSAFGDDMEPSQQWNLYGAKFLYMSPDGNLWESTGSALGTIRQKGLPVRCVKEF